MFVSVRLGCTNVNCSGAKGVRAARNKRCCQNTRYIFYVPFYFIGTHVVFKLRRFKLTAVCTQIVYQIAVWCNCCIKKYYESCVNYIYTWLVFCVNKKCNYNGWLTYILDFGSSKSGTLCKKNRQLSGGYTDLFL